MKITDVKILKLTGCGLAVGDLCMPREERLARPIDIYPEYDCEPGPQAPDVNSDGTTTIRGLFLTIETDKGITGIAGTIQYDVGFVIRNNLAKMLIGKDPRETDRIWDQLFRWEVHGHSGLVMQAISVIDCALWDLKGKAEGVPTFELLGGKKRDRVPVYAMTRDFSLEPARVRERARQFVAEGYHGQKWFVRYGPGQGEEGMDRNEELVSALREAVPDGEIMIDCWQSWDVEYTLAMGKRLKPYGLTFIEEPIFIDDLEGFKILHAELGIPIAAGEHVYTRWGYKVVMDAGILDYAQPDVYWSGGFSETKHIVDLIAARHVPVMLHTSSVPMTMHMCAALPVEICPLMEYFNFGNQSRPQYFFKHPVRPVGGYLELPTAPGVLEFDEGKIQRIEEITRF